MSGCSYYGPDGGMGNITRPETAQIFADQFDTIRGFAEPILAREYGRPMVLVHENQSQLEQVLSEFERQIVRRALLTACSNAHMMHAMEQSFRARWSLSERSSEWVVALLRRQQQAGVPGLTELLSHLQHAMEQARCGDTLLVHSPVGGVTVKFTPPPQLVLDGVYGWVRVVLATTTVLQYNMQVQELVALASVLRSIVGTLREHGRHKQALSVNSNARVAVAAAAAPLLTLDSRLRRCENLLLPHEPQVRHALEADEAAEINRELRSVHAQLQAHCMSLTVGSSKVHCSLSGASGLVPQETTATRTNYARAIMVVDTPDRTVRVDGGPSAYSLRHLGGAMELLPQLLYRTGSYRVRKMQLARECTTPPTVVAWERAADDYENALLHYCSSAGTGVLFSSPLLTHQQVETSSRVEERQLRQLEALLLVALSDSGRFDSVPQAFTQRHYEEQERHQLPRRPPPPSIAELTRDDSAAAAAANKHPLPLLLRSSPDDNDYALSSLSADDARARIQRTARLLQPRSSHESLTNLGVRDNGLAPLLEKYTTALRELLRTVFSGMRPEAHDLMDVSVGLAERLLELRDIATAEGQELRQLDATLLAAQATLVPLEAALADVRTRMGATQQVSTTLQQTVDAVRQEPTPTADQQRLLVDSEAQLQRSVELLRELLVEYDAAEAAVVLAQARVTEAEQAVDNAETAVHTDLNVAAYQARTHQEERTSALPGHDFRVVNGVVQWTLHDALQPLQRVLYNSMLDSHTTPGGSVKNNAVVAAHHQLVRTRLLLARLLASACSRRDMK